MARDRGYAEMQRLLEAALAGAQDAAPKGETVAAAIRERDLAKARNLLDADPALTHAPDELTNQPIHWAVMTRQLDVIDELLARGADINARRKDGARPIQLCNGDYNYRGWRDVPRDWPTTPRDVLDTSTRERRVRGHLHRRAHRRSGTGARTARRGPVAGQHPVGLCHLLRMLRDAAPQRRGRRTYRDRQVAPGAGRRPEFARRTHRAARPCALFGGLQWTLRDRQTAARTWRIPESGSRKLRRRGVHSHNEWRPADDRSPCLVRRGLEHPCNEGARFYL